jgi:2-C-methyl-D-erythritol 4-phosphate cytidylyltransferase
MNGSGGRDGGGMSDSTLSGDSRPAGTRASTAAVLVAGGAGTRLAADRPKALVSLADVPMAVMAARALADSNAFCAIFPVLPESHCSSSTLSIGFEDIPECRPAVPGGATRQDSVWSGLEVLGAEIEWVAIHDAARPLVRPEDVDRVVAVAQREGAAILAAPLADTVKLVEGGRVVATPDRAGCFAAQTPQVFRVDWLREAHAKARSDGFLGTDDADLVERCGKAVYVVEGHPGNRKITHPDDLLWAEALLRGQSVGDPA